MTGNQSFILELVKLLIPLLTLALAGWIAAQQVKARHEMDRLAKSVDGVKDELVATARAEGVATGAKDEADVGAARAVEVARENANGPGDT